MGTWRPLDGLRAVAALSIVLLHAWLYATPDGGTVALGWIGIHVMPDFALGVTLFFALSGYLLYLPWAAAMLDGEEAPRLGRYARRRAMRIFPA